MADYIANARSNYFQVKDPEVFRADAARVGLEVRNGDSEGAVMVTPDLDAVGDGAWPFETYDEETGDPEEFDLPQWLAGHLVDGQVAILQEVGSEKLRYLSGVSVAVNSKGETRVVTLSDIWEQAQELGENVTKPVL